LAGLTSIPGVGTIIQAARRHWAEHPLRATVDVVAETTKAIMQPIAQRHPVKVLLAYFLAVACLHGVVHGV